MRFRPATTSRRFFWEISPSSGSGLPSSCWEHGSPAGELLDKAQFLARTAGPRTLERLAGEDVRIRMLGDVAIIHAATRFTTLSGQDGCGRYTDDWQKRDGTWVCVSAHVTRL